ncbi:MAG: hypothetical protein PHQ05_12535 [Sterolibacterium sp.]|nr:hypothetical protein [Sterolibacterium sp.]
MLPNEASHLYDWTPTSRVSYGDFLRIKQLEGSIRYGIDNQNKHLIATNEQLSECGIEVLSVNPDRGFTMLSQNLGQVTDLAREGATEIVGRFNWGFSDALISQGQMNVQLAELIKLTKTATQTWACEQFEIGRDEFRRQLYPEALQSVTRAIEGQENNPGIKTEFRFHFLAGIIRLGSYNNSLSEVINPQLAQQAFLAAARCAQTTYPADAGQSLICAGRAALVEGAFDAAIVHTRKGLSFIPTHAVGMYQLARALFLKGETSEAKERLADAILLNVEQALHASGDPDIISKMDFLSGVLSQVQERYKARYRLVAERFRRAEKELRDYSFEDVPADDLQLKGLADIQKTRKSVEILAKSKTLFGYSSAINRLLDGFQLFPTCFEEFKTKCLRHLQEKLARPPRREDFSHGKFPDKFRSDHKSSGAWLASGIVSGMTIFVVHACQRAPPSYGGLLEATEDMFALPLLFGTSIALLTALLEYLYREYIRSKSKSALAAYDAAWYAYSNLKNLLENEMATIQGMSMPKECQPPSLANVTPSEASAKRERGQAWAFKL